MAAWHVLRRLRAMSASGRDVLLVSGGTALGQVGALLAAPIIARIYAPAQFGVFATFSAVIVTIGTVSTSRFELAIPLPAQERDAQGLATLGLGSVLAAGFLTFLVVLWAGPEVATAMRQSENQYLLWLLPPAIMAVGCYLILNQLAVRHAHFRAIGQRSAVQQVVTLGVQILFGMTAYRPVGLLIGMLAGQTSSGLSLLRGSGLRSIPASESRRLAVLKPLMWRYRRFPLMMGPSGLLNVLGVQLPVLLIAYWFGAAAAGWLGLTQRVLALPVALIGVAVGQVYLSRFAAMLRTDLASAYRLFGRASISLSLCALVSLVLLLFASPYIFQIAFGEAWLPSGTYAHALSFGFATQLVAAPLSQTLVALERQRLQLAWDFGRLVAVCLVLWVAKALAMTALEAVWCLSGGLTVTYLVSWTLSFFAIRARVRDVGCA